MKRTIQLIDTNDDRNILKRIGHNGQSAHPLYFSDISSIKSLKLAWQKFSRGKKSRRDVAIYHRDLKANLLNLHRLLWGNEYRHGKYRQFSVHDPKQRLIHKASVQDRIVHQVVVTALELVFERNFIHDSYSCREGKGTHAGVKRLRLFLGRASRNNTRKVYVLKCDIKKYFASIDHEILLQLIERKVNDEQILELLRTIILSHGDAIGKGIPLGNVTSQLFANIYLHELDWFVKQRLGVKYYIRYCDDFAIVSTDKDYLESLLGPIRVFLKTQLCLDLHPNKVSIRSWEQGVDFLGYVTRPYTTTLRAKTKKRALARVTEHNITSYLGLCAHANEYRLSQIMKLSAWHR